MRFRCSIAVPLLLGAVVCSANALARNARDAAPQVSAASLPQLVIEDLPGSVRANVQAAYDAARARPTDPSAVGGLAMMLHAYEQYRAAGDCYRIALQHEPTSARWTYLSGVVQAELGEQAAAAASFGWPCGSTRITSRGASGWRMR